MNVRAVAFALGLAATAPVQVAADGTRAAFVGCRADGQLGPRRPPRSGPSPILPPEVARRLSYYGTYEDGIGTLAPSGWTCASRYGSDGNVIFVAPNRATLSSLVKGVPIRRAAVVRRRSYSSTSGRFEVARVAAMLFPSLGRFVADVEAEDVSGPFHHGLPKGDRITRRGPLAVLFTTSAAVRGVGTSLDFAPGPLPVDGFAIAGPETQPDLDATYARLPPADRPLMSYLVLDGFSRADGASRPALSGTRGTR